jgi:hypothetical protein
MESVVANFSPDTDRASVVREFGEKAVDQCAASDGFDTGDW